ncbi:MAG: DoxX family protein [Gammaproteobacteria bacterium]
MVESATPAPLSKGAVWSGRVLSALVVVFLLFDGIVKFMMIQPVTDAFNELGYPVKHAILIGAIDVACAVLFAIPRTAVLGAVLMTGLLGGAISTHVRIDSPLFSNTLFGVYLGLIAWAGLYLREPRVRALLPLRS